MTLNRTAVISAPAKINLGLEILGQRDDGYHEIRTILAAIDLSDSLRITMVPDKTETRISGVPGVKRDDNLIKRAVDAFAEETGLRNVYDVDVTKRIPSPGGLGGASSDAASTLKALNALHNKPVSLERMVAIAETLGSDVPFFIGSPLVFATGTGTQLEPLPAIEGWVVLIVPRVTMAAKTPTLYAALRGEDFTRGEGVAQGSQAIRNHALPSPDLLHNTFTRPLYEMQPELLTLAGQLVEAGAPHVKLSGAGPGHYVLLETEHEANALAAELRSVIPPNAVLTVVSLCSDVTSVELFEK